MRWDGGWAFSGYDMRWSDALEWELGIFSGWDALEWGMEIFRVSLQWVVPWSDPL